MAQAVCDVKRITVYTPYLYTWFWPTLHVRLGSNIVKGCGCTVGALLQQSGQSYVSVCEKEGRGKTTCAGREYINPLAICFKPGHASSTFVQHASGFWSFRGYKSALKNRCLCRTSTNKKICPWRLLKSSRLLLAIA